MRILKTVLFIGPYLSSIPDRNTSKKQNTNSSNNKGTIKKTLGLRIYYDKRWECGVWNPQGTNPVPLQPGGSSVYRRTTISSSWTKPPLRSIALKVNHQCFCKNLFNLFFLDEMAGSVARLFPCSCSLVDRALKHYCWRRVLFV